jgi:serine protease SohB
VDLAKVATGEAWYGQRAIDLNLVDEIATSDAYLMQKCEDADVFEIRWVEQKKPLERVLGQIENGINQLTQLFQGRGSL